MKFDNSFIDKMKKLLGEEESSKFFVSLENPSQKAITINTTKLSKNRFEEIADFDFQPIPQVDNGYYVDNLKFGTHPLNHLGIIYSQEPSAMYPVEMLNIKEGDIVLDVCSAPGGKSVQILEKLNNTGLLVSNEIVYNRAKILYENLTRMGFSNSVITCNNPQDFERTNLKFDKILIDAPCGGEGMFRKENFDFDSYNSTSIETNSKRQLSILNSIKGLLKNGGQLVYSTCTYDIRENENVIAQFLNENPDFVLCDCPLLDSVTSPGIDIDKKGTDRCKRRYPHLFKGEGQFMALLTKSSNHDEHNQSNQFKAKGFENIYKKDVEVIQKAFKNTANIKGLNIVKRNDNFYVLPDTIMNFENLNVVNVGCLLGTITSNSFKIAHEFYRMYSHLFENVVEIKEDNIVNYLKGYEIETDCSENGVCVITYLGIALGGGKVVNGKIKNYYPKNLRIN